MADMCTNDGANITPPSSGLKKYVKKFSENKEPHQDSMVMLPSISVSFIDAHSRNICVQTDDLVNLLEPTVRLSDQHSFVHNSFQAKEFPYEFLPTKVCNLAPAWKKVCLRIFMA